MGLTKDMIRRNKDLWKWWMDRIKTLTDLKPTPSEILSEVAASVPKANEYIYQKDHAWPGIKLSILAYYLDIYTNIAKNNFKEICYVDTFAGSGIIHIKSGIDSVLLYGSPILSILVPRENKKFSKYFFIDNDLKKSIVLERAVEVLHKRGLVDKSKVKILTADMNNIQYSDLLKECAHSLVFVDPEGMEPKWTTIKSILELKTDVLFNFMTAGIRRVWGRAKSDGVGYELLNSFFGNNAWKHAEKEDKLLELYINNVKNLNKVVLRIRVRGTKQFYYDVLVITRPTKGGNPWLQAVRKYLKPNVEKTDSNTFARLLKVFTGKVKPLM